MNQNGLNGFHHPSNSIPPNSIPYSEYPSMNPYRSSMPVPQQPQSSTGMPAMSSHQPWSAMTPQNALPPQVQQHQHLPFNSSQWTPQIQPQNFSNVMPSMFGIPMSVQQLLHEAATMVTPIGKADEALLVQALLDSENNGTTYKDALNGLHGRNNHSGSLWKDYYLEHKHRLDRLVRHSTTFVKTAKKPSPDSYNINTSKRVRSNPPAPVKHIRHSVQPTIPIKTSTKRRKTINSLTTHTPVFGNRLPPPNAQIVAPVPPSRSPTPPTTVIPHIRGNRYTAADKEFFLKFISWRLKGDPTLTRMDLCRELEAKAPHHSELSWASYWSNNHDVPDKIMATAKGEDFTEDQTDSDEQEESDSTLIKTRQPSVESASEAEDDDGSDEDFDEGSSSADERDMGPSGGSYTAADLRVAARHVASIPDFKAASFYEKWEVFSQRYPQRSAKAWAEFYRKQENAVNRLAKKYRAKKQIQSRSIYSQRGRPSWTLTSEMDGTNPPKAKRKFAFSDDERVESSRSKRTWNKDEEDEDEDGEDEDDEDEDGEDRVMYEEGEFEDEDGEGEDGEGEGGEGEGGEGEGGEGENIEDGDGEFEEDGA